MTANPSVSYSVAVADPNFPQNFIKPNADGSINVIGGGGGGGGAVTIADGADVAEGSTTDAAATAGGTGTVSAKLRRISAQLPAALGQTTMSASQPVAIASDQSSIPVVATGNVASGVTDSGNPVKVGGVFNTTLPTLTNGQRSDLQTDNRGNLRTIQTAAILAGSDGGSNSLAYLPNSNGGSSNALAVAPTLFNGTTWDRARSPNLTSRLPSSAATTNATSSKASTAWLFSVSWYNTNAAARFLKIYNKASAPTVGTDTPFLTIALPQTAGNSITFQSPLYLSTGLAFALTVNASDADTTAVGAGDVVGLNLVYS